MFIKKSVEKYQSVSDKQGGFIIIFKPVRKSIFEQTYMLCVFIWEFLPDMTKVYNRPGHTWLIILIRFITFKNNWINL